jgi:hypothetical protein
MFKIRPEQKAAFREDALHDFEERMILHVERCFPGRRVELGDEGLRQVIRRGIEQAASYGIVAERDVCKFVDLMLVFGVDFHEERSWAKAILEDASIRDPVIRMRLLFERALDESSPRRRAS